MKTRIEKDNTISKETQKNNNPIYRPPELVVIGKAVDLVQGYSSGKRSDGYSGFYWE